MARQRALSKEEAEHVRELYWKEQRGDRYISYDHLAAMFRTSNSTIKNVINRNGAYSKKEE